VGCKQGNELLRGESSAISHASEDLVERVLRLGNETVGCGSGSVGTPGQELKTGCTRAVGDADSSSELDEVTGSDVVVSLEEGRESVDTITDTEVGVEIGLDIGEDDWGTISTSSRGQALVSERLRERDGVICE
jgi:hypothetical protein